MRNVKGWVVGAVLCAAAGVGGLVATGCVGISSSRNGGVVGEARTQERIARGAYLVQVAACNDCHTPFKMGPDGPEPDMSRMLSGHPEDVKLPPAPKAEGPWNWGGSATNTAFHGPWGVTYAFNLTPDETTGLAVWTEAMFVTALKEGKHMGVSRPIMPPMPWPAYSHMTDEDLKSIYAYLRSIPPVKNRVPEYAPPGHNPDAFGDE